MATNFPKLPGYVPTHDPFNEDFNPKKVSHVHLDKIRNHKDELQFSKPVPLYAVPNPPVANFTATKTEASKSLSHTQFPNHYGEDINEQFEPVYVKLDKQVSHKKCSISDKYQKFLRYLFSLTTNLSMIKCVSKERVEGHSWGLV